MNPVVHFTIHLFQAWNTVINVYHHPPEKHYTVHATASTALWGPLSGEAWFWRTEWCVMWARGRRRQERHFWNRQREAEDTRESGKVPRSPSEEVLGTTDRRQLALQAGLFLKECLALLFLPQGKSKKSMRNSNTLATWCRELIYLKRPWCWERLRAGGEGDNRRLDDWMASLTQWTWVWVDSRSWWWRERPGVLRFMGSESRTWLSDLTEHN